MEKATEVVQPALETTWKKGAEFSRVGTAKALEAYEAAKKQSAEAWKTAQPALIKGYKSSQACCLLKYQKIFRAK